MNRPIKYRYWNSKEGRVYGQTERGWDAFPHTLHEGDAWLQFTGLTGKNGKEIYEGDIVRVVPDEKKAFTNEPHHPSFMYGDVAKVEWDDVNAKFSLFDVHGEDTEIGYYAGWSGWNWLEVIGNLYENPELLSV